LTPSEHLSRNEIDAAGLARSGEFNAQNQSKLEWPAASVVARAYLDQLARSRSLPADRLASVRAALDRADRIRSLRDRDARAVVEQLNAQAARLERDAASATGRDAVRLQSLAATLEGRAAAVR
jgi:hypothetical protein